MSNIQTSLVIIFAAFCGGFVLHFLVAFFIKRWGRLRDGKGSLSIHILIKPLRLLIPGVCVFITLPWLHFPARFQPVILHVVQLWLIGAGGWLVVKAVQMVREMILDNYDVTVADNLRARSMTTQIHVIGRIVNFLVILLTVSFMIMTFAEARQIGISLLASAGIAGVVLGFAAQKTLGNLLAGIQIAFAQPIRIDDVVIVENEWGRIEDITLTYVVVRIWDLRRLVLPISYFVEKPFQNWTRVSADLLGSVYIYADYRVDVQGLRDKLAGILAESPLWDKKVCTLQVTNMTDQTVELRALMSTPDSSSSWNLRCSVREELLRHLQTAHPEHLPRTRVELNPQPKQ